MFMEWGLGLPGLVRKEPSPGSQAPCQLLTQGFQVTKYHPPCRWAQQLWPTLPPLLHP